MRRALFAFIAFIVAIRSFAGDCGTNPTLSINPADNTATIAVTEADASKVETIKEDDSVTVEIGDTKMQAIVDDVTDFGSDKLITLQEPLMPALRAVGGANAPEFSSDKATLQWTEKNGTAHTVDLCVKANLNIRQRSWHVGGAVAENASSDTSTTDTHPGAMRFQYSESLVRFIPRESPTTKVPSANNAQQELKVSIDTTDRNDKAFVDDNKLSAGYYTPRYTVGSLLNRARLGLSGDLSRGFHSNDRNADLGIAVDGWLPVFQTLTLFSNTRYLTPPLSFNLSGGRRWQNVSGTRSTGNVAKAVLGYHLYLFDNYRLDFEHTSVFNGASDASSTSATASPRTQHSYKVAVNFAESVESKFAAVASFESGHSGPIFTKLRQYFVGVGLQNIFGSPAAK